jgi:hypothetical protein
VTRARLSRDLYLGFAIAFIGIRLVSLSPWDQSVDAYAYWSTRAGPLYNGSSVGAVGSYLYSPAFALLIAPIGWLSWPVFNALWTTMNVAILWKLAGRWSFVALVFVPIPLEIIAGNVHLLFAAVAVYGIRYPALWAIPLITKVTPGIGLVWFAVRGEWRSLAVAMGVTGVLVVVSYLLSPQAWSTWIDLLVRSDSAPTSTPGFYRAHESTMASAARDDTFAALDLAQRPGGAGWSRARDHRPVQRPGRRACGKERCGRIGRACLIRTALLQVDEHLGSPA